MVGACSTSAAVRGSSRVISRFDLVVSRLALHYVDDYPRLDASIADWLTPGGVVVFSTEHPIYTARLPDDDWVRGDTGGRRWALNDYMDEGARHETWFGSDVRKVHHIGRLSWNSRTWSARRHRVRLLAQMTPPSTERTSARTRFF